ncbi:hypothetical protein ACMG4M_01970 [Alcanivorax sp. IL3]|uniref:hypothetical protein n=1 Tax=unclassified Alcanivorax TaxID=2638842 RepID=UPI0039C010EB
MKTFMMTALAAAMASSVAVAEVSVPNTFTQGENAVAEEVNANFGALVASIEESNSRIAVLEEQLESSKSLDVAGSGYVLQRSSASLVTKDAEQNGTGDFAGWAVELVNERFFLTFNEDADNTVSLVFDIEQEGRLENYINGLSLETEEDDQSETETLYWTQEGNSLHLSESLGGDPVIEFIVAEGGSIIYSSFTEVRNEKQEFDDSCGELHNEICYKEYFDSGSLLGIRQSVAQQ